MDFGKVHGKVICEEGAWSIVPIGGRGSDRLLIKNAPRWEAIFAPHI